jgi:Raf kinase inhibitor-like YbhB/YbcL family protein
MRDFVMAVMAFSLTLASPAGCRKTAENKGGPTAGKEQTQMSIKLSSPAFEPGKPIPKKHAYRDEGDNISPPLQWSGVPEGTASLALICEDPDAPSPNNPRPDPWVHWVLYDIPAGDSAGLAEGDSGGAVVGVTDFGKPGWGGPLPPKGSGTHRYFFRLYALDSKLGLPPGASKAQLMRAMEGHILARGELYGTYER